VWYRFTAPVASTSATVCGDDMELTESLAGMVMTASCSLACVLASSVTLRPVPLCVSLWQVTLAGSGFD
jgi:hypothetical protein